MVGEAIYDALVDEEARCLEFHFKRQTSGGVSFFDVGLWYLLNDGEQKSLN